MKTPISDFIEKYAKSDFSRFHMPGHKGKSFLGVEEYDITEIDGADVLSMPEGIIKESEENLSLLYGSGKSFYLTGGSTTAIYAMLAMIKKKENEKTIVLAARNVHKAFVNGCALLDIDAHWIMPEESRGLLSCKITREKVEEAICASKVKYAAVYLTSPDYLGFIQDIKGISEVCRKYGIPLLVDNAHGAYLKFLEESMHPLDMGAAICCDSAHKTLRVLTGGAYLHISSDYPCFYENANEKIALFSSTSPSYLILKSMDMCNSYLSCNFREELKVCIEKINDIKKFIKEKGFSVAESEMLKIVINAKESGYTGRALAEIMRKEKIEAEFYDEDYLVFMITPQNSEEDFLRLKEAFCNLKPEKAIISKDIVLPYPVKEMSIREAVFSENEIIDVEFSENRVCAAVTVSCPPAVPIALSGERITKEVIENLKYYGIKKIKVVKP